MKQSLSERLNAAAGIAALEQIKGNTTKTQCSSRAEAFAIFARLMEEHSDWKALPPRGNGMLVEGYAPGTSGLVAIYKSNIVVTGGHVECPTIEELTDADYKNGDVIFAAFEAALESIAVSADAELLVDA